MSNWNKIGKPIVVLGIICIVITSALAMTNKVTAPIIEEAKRVAEENARMELLPDAQGFTQVDYSGEGISAIYQADNGVGTIITCSAKGYGGDIVVMVAFQPDGTVKQIKIQEQTETAGLGAKISTDTTFQNSFSGLPAENFTVDDISAITGATISSKAVTKAVNFAIDAYNAIS